MTGPVSKVGSSTPTELLGQSGIATAATRYLAIANILQDSIMGATPTFLLRSVGESS